jgi:nucleotide-binding universal stress UspA family protein
MSVQSSFDHILVPVDFTEKNAAAITVAKRLAVQSSARVSLLHVIESLEDAGDDEEIQKFMERMEARSSDHLQRLLEQFADCDLEVTPATMINHRSQGIVLYAVENAVDLIVMGSHPIDPSAIRDSWATISYQVSLLCPCSILLIKPTID